MSDMKTARPRIPSPLTGAIFKKFSTVFPKFSSIFLEFSFSTLFFGQLKWKLKHQMKFDHTEKIEMKFLLNFYEL
jgi:hypothetical protein